MSDGWQFMFGMLTFFATAGVIVRLVILAIQRTDVSEELKNALAAGSTKKVEALLISHRWYLSKQQIKDATVWLAGREDS